MSEHHVVVLDGYALNPGDLSWDALSLFGTVQVYDRTPADQVQSRIDDADIVLTNKTKLDAQTIGLCRSVRYIGVLATGYNVVDVAAARKQGIVVTNIPAYGTMAVAQFAIALLLELCSHVACHDEAVHQKRWEQSADFCFWDKPLVELSGKTMGIIGFGAIGQAVGRIAAALGMDVLAYTHHPNPDVQIPGCRYAQLKDVLELSDVISLHCPLNEGTREIINAATISRMKDGVMIINNSRGPLIDEQALADALRSGKVGAAAVDVLSEEPPASGNPLLDAPNCIITPHISWAAYESRRRLMDIAVENISAYVQGSAVNVVS